MLYVGLCSVTFRNLTHEQIINAAAEVGIQCIEWGSDVHAPCKDIARIEEIAKMQKEAGLFCSSYGTYFEIGRETPEDLYDYIRAAKILGTNILRLWAGVKGSAEYTPEELEEFYAQCRVLAKIAEEEQVVLCMEAHANTLTDAIEPACALMEAVNSPAFRMYFQPKGTTVEESVTYARLIAPYTYNIHVPCSRRSLTVSFQNWKNDYLPTLNLTGDHAMLLEFMPEPHCLACLPTEVAALKELIGG